MSQITTVMTLTDNQIWALHREAAEHGDLDQVAICMRALGDDGSDAEPGTALAECMLSENEARTECARVIATKELAAIAW